MENIIITNCVVLHLNKKKSLLVVTKLGWIGLVGIGLPQNLQIRNENEITVGHQDKIPGTEGLLSRRNSQETMPEQNDVQSPGGMSVYMQGISVVPVNVHA